jgi:hypothetical protein
VAYLHFVWRYSLNPSDAAFHSFDLISRTFAAPKISRRDTRDAAKGSRKVILVLETQIEAHIEHAESRVPQKFARTEDAPVENVSMRAEASASLK